MRLETSVLALMMIAGATLAADSSPARRGPSVSTRLLAELRHFRAYPHLDQAYRLIKSHKFADAKRELEACLAVDSDNVAIWSLYVDVLSELKEYDSLVAHLNNRPDLLQNAPIRKSHLFAQLERRDTGAVLQDLRALVADHRLTKAEMELIASRFLALAREQQRADLLVALLASVPDSAVSAATAFEIANALHALGRLNDASATYERIARASDAGNLRLAAYKALISLAIERQQWSQAWKFLRQARPLGPGDLFVLRSLGQVAAERRDWNESIRSYRRWVKLSGRAAAPDDRYAAYMTLGYSYSRLGQHRSAATMFRSALQARPNDVQALLAASQALQQAGDPAEAIDPLRLALTVAPTGDLNARIGLLYAQVGRHSDALPYLVRAKQLGVSAPLMPLLLGQIGYTYSALHQLTAARDAFTDALPRSGNQAQLHAALGRTSLDLQDFSSAIDHFQQSLSHQDDLEVWRVLALAYAGAGDFAAVDRIIEAHPGSTAGNDRVWDDDLLRQLAALAFGGGHFREAATWFRRASNVSTVAGWQSLARAAESLERAGALSEAAETWNQLKTSEHAPEDLRAYAAEGAGYLQVRLAQTDRAVASFALAIGLGRDAWRLHLDRALALIKLERWKEALDDALASVERQDTARGRLAVALCFKALDKPGMAVHHLARSLEHGAELGPTDRKYVLDELVYLYADEANYDDAAAAARDSLAISDDPVIALRLARIQRLLGKGDDARVTLAAIDGSSLPKTLRAAVLDEQARLRADVGDKEHAAEALQEALALEPSDARLYQLGLYYSDIGNLGKAVSSFQASLDAKPDNARYREALGYAYLRAGRLKDAAGLLDAVSRDDPGYVQVQQDLAYTLLRLGDEPGAVARLRQALNSIESETDMAGRKNERQQIVSQMQSTITQLENRYQGAVYFGYHAIASPSSATGTAATPLLLSQTGVELSRFLSTTQRGWSAFGRIMSSEGMANSGPLTQLGIGVRYKPFRTQNFNVSAERLFQLGDGSSHSWLVRALFSQERGSDLEPDRQWHPYSLVYGDVGQFIGPYPSLLAYGETRYGMSRSLNASWAIRPHALAIARHLQATGGGDALQLGAGIGITYHFGPKSLQRYGPSLETRLYGSGALAEASGVGRVTGAKGLTLVTAVRFWDGR